MSGLSRAGQQLFGRGLILLLALGLAACTRGEQIPPTSGAGQTPGSEVAGAVVTETPFVLPTLLPTRTVGAAPATVAPATPRPSPSPQSTVDFGQPVVEVRYRIPALQLDRRLEGDVSGQITVVDETRGLAAIRQNQGGVLLELQGVLPALSLEPLPAGCDRCVAFSYALPLDSVEGEGWLQEPVLLASVENYTAALLGPHFPPQSVLGLRRGATAYDVAHSLALDANGTLYRWLATAGEVNEPVPVETVTTDLAGLLAGVETAALQEQYVVNCIGAPLETLYLRPTGVDSPSDDAYTIRVACPAFSLPRSLLPLYLRLDALMEETLHESGIPRPPSEVDLDAVLDYRRDDGAHLALVFDGLARIDGGLGDVVTSTLSVTEILSVTEALLNSGVMRPGLEAFTAAELPNLLLVRGDEGMMEAAWPEGVAPAAILEAVAVLDGLLDGGGVETGELEIGD